MTDHQHPTAKPEGEGAPVDAAIDFMDAAAAMLGRGEMPAPGTQYAADWYLAHNTVLTALRASPPVPAVAGEPVDWRWTIGGAGPWVYAGGPRRPSFSTGQPGDVRNLMALYDGPTPSADQSGVIGALVKALEKIAHEARPVTRATMREYAAAALAAHAASIGGKS